jgi:hypothetical protein
MTRELTGHKVNPANDKLSVLVLDEPGSGGAHHAYVVLGDRQFEDNPAVPLIEAYANALPDTANGVALIFQQGPIAEAGVNGITHEVLLEVLIDRLTCFQTGPFANQYNQVALDACKLAQDSLLQRTRDRMARGVEGTHTV